MNYRLDIQGLRAVAILAVVIFHLNPAWLPGGFVGVDIFFVISGYLITQILYQAKNNDQPVLRFYLRRIVRLFPAYFVMLLGSAICAYLLLFPKETIDFSHSLISALIYLSNIYFSSHINYLTVDTHLLPLLHTWSLSAEAQCYLVYPLVFYFILRQKIATGKLLFCLFIVMFILCLLLTAYNPDIAFFSPTVRFYQFLAGAVIVFIPTPLKSNNRLINYSLVLGLIFVFASFFAINPFTQYPGVWSLLPTLGSALMIFAGTQGKSFFLRFLDNKLMVFIGTISYSLYLWHWPTIVFYKIAVSPSLAMGDYILIILTSILLAMASWYLVENKFRQFLLITSTKKVFSLTTLATLFLAIISSIYVFSDGLRNRYSQQQLFFAETDFSQTSETVRATDSCMIYKNWIESFTEQKCIHIQPDKTNILLLGDSHAEQFRRALEDYSDELSISVTTISACRPTFPTIGRKTCAEMVERVYTDLINKYEFDIVLISARWSDKVIELIPNSIKVLKNHVDRVIILGPIITYAYSLPKLLARYGTNPDDTVSLKKFSHYDRTLKVDHNFEQLAKANGAEYISLLKLICPNEQCQATTKNGNPIQWDYGHLTYDGAAELIPKLNLL